MSKYYNNLECPLSIFRDIQLGKSLELLLIDGVFDEVEANDAWLTIYDLYNEEVKSNKNNTGFEKQKQLQVLSNKYSIVKACLFLIYQKIEVNVLNIATGLDKDFVKHDYTEQVQILNSFGFRVDINNIESELLRVSKQKENIKTQINVLKKDLEKEGKQSNSYTINDTIFSAQKHQGFPFSKDAKVIDLVVCLNDLIRSNNLQKKHGK